MKAPTCPVPSLIRHVDLGPCGEPVDRRVTLRCGRCGIRHVDLCYFHARVLDEGDVSNCCAVCLTAGRGYLHVEFVSARPLPVAAHAR